MNTYILLYQCGLANVFRVDANPDKPQRVLQHAFTACEWFARGLIEAGHEVIVKHANVAGDAVLQLDRWEDGPGTMFEESKRPPVAA